MIEKTQFQKENDQVLEYILETVFFREFRRDRGRSEKDCKCRFELNITASCNQSCQYCYLINYGDKIYPKEIRKPKKILENIRIYLNYAHEKGLDPKRWELFSGEIWGTQFGYDVLDIIIEYIEKDWFHPGIIMIPSNCSFIYDDNSRHRIQNYINKFDKLDVRLIFSISNDGYCCEPTSRPFNSSSDNQLKYDEKNYDKLFKWARYNDYAFHPMVSASNVDKWVDNYDWWKKKFDEYHFELDNHLMTLEVRNDDWTDESITNYLKYLDHMINVNYKYAYGGDINKLADYICGVGHINGYLPYALCRSTDFTCGIKYSLIVRMGDLSIGPCHRTHYPELIYGKFDVEDGRITGISANNIQLANRVLLCRKNGSVLCDRCAISDYCIMGCMGSQYESTKEPLYPCESVCELEKAKVIYLFVKSHKTDIAKIALAKSPECEYAMNRLSDIVEKLKLEDEKLWRKWGEISYQVSTDLD